MTAVHTSRPDFDAAYRADDDPFDVGTSWYEQRKIAVTLAALTQQRYRRIWDTACGTGHLTRSLADRCDSLVASDLSPRAVELTAARLADDPTDGRAEVTTQVHGLPEALGHHEFDLIVLSEVVYYLPTLDLLALPSTLLGSATPDRSEVVLVNWRHHPHDAPRSGEHAAGLLDAALTEDGWALHVRHDDADFVLRSWVRAQ
ncbi:MAG: class I SAM-dependent methyltransferase [Nakamurella sp.]